MIDTLIWKTILGYEGLYKISNTGEVWSIKYGAKRKLPSKETKKEGLRYVNIDLSRNGEKKWFGVHVLVCEAFRGARPVNMVCSHIDDNPLNNRIENLCWETQKDNLSRSKKYKDSRSRIGKSNKGRKNSKETIIKKSNSAKLAWAKRKNKN
jgi:hypothetical protein